MTVRSGTSDDGSLDKSHQEEIEVAPSVGSDDVPSLTPDEQRQVVRTIDWRVIPLLFFLYLLTFLDRVNIGNARLWNLERDLGMSGYDYNIAIVVFFIPYILLEIPSNMLLTRVEPRYYLSFLIMGWGLTVTMAGFATNFAGLVTARIFIGIFEAGMFPACVFLIGSWYRRHHLLTRMALFLVSNDIAGTVSALLGAGLGSLDGLHGYSGWSWIFFVEGAVTCAAAVLAFFYIPPFPHQSTFLSPRQKAWLLQELDRDNQVTDSRHEKMSLHGVANTFRDWKVYAAGTSYLAVCVTGYSLSVFTPTILTTFGWGSLKSNLLSAPVRLLSGVISVLMGWLSDRARRRGPFCLGGYSLSITGLLLCMISTNGNLRYAGLYVASAGIYICQPLVIAWSVNQVVGNVKRGTFTAFAVSFGQIGGIISAVVFPSKDGPQYVPGISTCIAFQGLGIVTALVMWIMFYRENKARDRGKLDHLRNLPPQELATLGEGHPDFRFTL